MEKNYRDFLVEKIKAIKRWRLNRRVSQLLITVLVAALAGGVAGFYGYSLAGGELPLGNTIIRNITERQEFAEDQLVIEVAEKSSPAVVSIVATKDLQVFNQRQVNPFCNDPFFRQFFSDSECRSTSTPQTQRQQVSAGSGFIVRSDGLLITNKHVVDIAQADFTVITSDGKKYPAQVLAKDPLHDFAMLKISGSGFPILPLGDSGKLKIGQSVVAIGNALGEFSNTVSRGLVSGLSRSIIASSGSSSERLEQLIQTDAAINLGNSGGPLLNLRGEVIGINTAIAQDAQNIGFAIPIDQVKVAINQVSTQGRISYPYLGVRYQMITPELKQARSLKVDQGALVSGDAQNPAVVPGSPAERAGLREGDIILSINGLNLTSEQDLAKVVQGLQVGQAVQIKLWRADQTLTLALTLGERN